MGYSPQDAIRRYLDEQGGRTDAFVGQLMDTWQLAAWVEADRIHVQEDLASVDVYSDPPLVDTAVPGDALVLFVAAKVPDAAASQRDPSAVVRHTVVQNGGSYETDVGDLLNLFGREDLTDTARSELTRVLAGVGIGVRPELSSAERTDPIELYLLQPAAAATRPTASAGPSAWHKLRPRTWKAWIACAFAGLVLLAVLTVDDPGDSGSSGPRPAVKKVVPSDDDAAEQRRLKRERGRHARDRTEQRRERADIRKAQAATRRRRARRARAAEQRRLEQEARQVAPPPEPEPEPKPVESCHPSYDPCLDPDSSDYDCEGGSGDGPDYTGPVTVTGSDDYDLDSDGDGSACES